MNVDPSSERDTVTPNTFLILTLASLQAKNILKKLSSVLFL